MSFSRTNALGWALYEVLTSSQMNSLDIDHANAIDGAAGGTYAPSSPLDIDNLRNLEWAAGFYPQVTSRNIINLVPIAPMYISDKTASSSCLNFGNDFANGSSTEFGGLEQKYVNTGGTGNDDPYIVIPWSPRTFHGTLESISFSWSGGGGHGGSNPARPPTCTLYKLPYDSTSPVTIATATDPMSTPAIYDDTDPHRVDATGLTESLDPDDWDTYYFQVRGEGGANSVVGAVLAGIQASITVSEIRP